MKRKSGCCEYSKSKSSEHMAINKQVVTKGFPAALNLFSQSGGQWAGKQQGSNLGPFHTGCCLTFSLSAGSHMWVRVKHYDNGFSPLLPPPTFILTLWPIITFISTQLLATKS